MLQLGRDQLAVPGSEKAENSLPLWLMDAGVTFTFEDRTAEDLLFGEVEALLDEYHKMPGLVFCCWCWVQTLPWRFNKKGKIKRYELNTSKVLAFLALGKDVGGGVRTRGQASSVFFFL